MNDADVKRREGGGRNQSSDYICSLMKIRDLGKKEEGRRTRSLAYTTKPCGNNSNGTRAPILPLHLPMLEWFGLLLALDLSTLAMDE